MKKYLGLLVLLIGLPFLVGWSPPAGWNTALKIEETDGDPSGFMTKLQFPSGGLSVSGRTATYTGGGTITGDVTITKADPLLTLWNTQHENTDGGRQSQIIWKGEKTDGNVRQLGYITVSHDGAGDDYKGKMVFSLNDTDDADNALQPYLTLLSSGNFGVGLISGVVDALLHVEKSSATTNAAVEVARLTALSTGTAAAGFGPQLYFEAETATDGTMHEAGAISAQWTDATAATEDSYLSFHTVASSGLNERVRITSLGTLEYHNTGVTHGLTSLCPTNVFGQSAMLASDYGGHYILGISDDAARTGMHLRAVIGGTDPTDTIPSLILQGGKADGGTSYTALAAAETVLQINNYTTTLATFLGSGNLGLGTVTPAQKLHLYDATGGVWSVIQTDGTNVDPNFQLQSKTDGYIFKVDEDQSQRLLLYGANGVGTITASPILTTWEQDGDVAIGALSPDAVFHIERDAVNTNTPKAMFYISVTSTGTPAAGLGSEIQWELETAAGTPGNQEIVAELEVIATAVTGAAEAGAMIFKTMTGGAAATEKFRVGADNVSVSNAGFVTSYETVQAATEAGVAAVGKMTTFLVSDGDADNDEDTFSLADGVAGQIKYVVFKTDTDGADSVNITPANGSFTDILFDTPGEGATLMFDGTNWHVVSNNGGTIT
uniref:Uncharacterized protein n=1 Tax=viral metagenome TaxID=1070528 RepID=A0A6M3KJZ7_9ZZZZ